ncbi:hypothetical protein GG344DRAFT_75757 [Lentinula edodes]|nr:hypothetical protein GG344DRAFT_75757 [Lentinula edodes]
MNKNCPISVSDINMQRRFPNEISSIVVDYLVDDPPALQNVALICHDFASLAQSRIFERVSLEDGSKLASGYMPWSRWSRYQRHDYVPLMYRFNALLSNPQASFLGKFVRRLDLDPCLGPLRTMEHAEVDVTISSIFQQLPSLTELRINHGRCEHFGAVETYLSQQLKELWIGHTTIHDQKCFEYFQNMLTSLTALTRLTINNCSLSHALDVGSNPIRALIFPSSLKAACITGTNERTFRALGLGLECPQAPVLSSFLSDFRNEVEDRSILWKGLGTNSSIILDVGNMMYWPGGLTMWNRADPITSYLPAMISVTRGIEGPNLTLCCSQFYQLIAYFAHFISVLPESVRRICIDFNAGATDGPPDLHHLDGWVKLDSTLMDRHAIGLLESVCFRCTKRTISGNGPSFKSGSSLDRTILNRVSGLLHRSDEAGMLEIDYATLFFNF